MLLISSTVHSQSVFGVGTRDCSAFSFAIAQDSNQSLAIDSFLSWAQGFISGFNAGNSRAVDIAIDHGGLVHWLGAYCSTNPDIPFYQAIQETIGVHCP